MINFQLESSMGEFLKLYEEQLRKAEVRAMVSTFNEIVKYTLPNTPKTMPTTKHATKNPSFDYNKQAASKVVPEMKENLKKLRARIKHDIIGNGKLNNGIPTAENTQSGKIDPDTLKGKIFASFVVRKDRKKKNKKLTKQVFPSNYTNSSKKLLNHIFKTTYMRKASNVGYRLRNKGTSVIWIDSGNTAKEAANELSKSAGVLLMGWRNLEKKVMSHRDSNGKTILDKLLVNTRNASKGMGAIQQAGDAVIMKATNKNVSKYDQGYQQRVVDDNIQKNLGKHLEREINYINTSKLRKQALKKK